MFSRKGVMKVAITKMINNKCSDRKNFLRTMEYVSNPAKNPDEQNSISQEWFKMTSFVNRKLYNKEQSKRQFKQIVVSLARSWSANPVERSNCRNDLKKVKEACEMYFMNQGFRAPGWIHCNTAHPHFHMILETCNAWTGKQFSQSKSDLADFKDYISSKLMFLGFDKEAMIDIQTIMEEELLQDEEGTYVPTMFSEYEDEYDDEENDTYTAENDSEIISETSSWHSGTTEHENSNEKIKQHHCWMPEKSLKSSSNSKTEDYLWIPLGDISKFALNEIKFPKESISHLIQLGDMHITEKQKKELCQHTEPSMTNEVKNSDKDIGHHHLIKTRNTHSEVNEKKELCQYIGPEDTSQIPSLYGMTADAEEHSFEMPSCNNGITKGRTELCKYIEPEDVSKTSHLTNMDSTHIISKEKKELCRYIEPENISEISSCDNSTAKGKIELCKLIDSQNISVMSVQNTGITEHKIPEGKIELCKLIKHD